MLLEGFIVDRRVEVLEVYQISPSDEHAGAQGLHLGSVLLAGTQQQGQAEQAQQPHQQQEQQLRAQEQPAVLPDPQTAPAAPTTFVVPRLFYRIALPALHPLGKR